MVRCTVKKTGNNITPQKNPIPGALYGNRIKEYTLCKYIKQLSNNMPVLILRQNFSHSTNRYRIILLSFQYIYVTLDKY